MSKSLREQVAVIGVGCTKFGDNVDQSLADMMVDATREACADAGVTLDQLQAAWLGTFSPGFNGGKASITLADSLRFRERPITRVENYCATGTDAFRNAAAAISAGLYDMVLVLGSGEVKGPSRSRLAT